uniref:uncharacterized protein LOC120339721 n=1 Tax=Styela clava TaxID=7725 RepID=UPI0019396812|nr:uncharacterized protein LOC120339721 [Styela clava]
MDYPTLNKRTKPIPGGSTEEEYRQVMRKIMEGLTTENLETVLFLCKDHIPHGREVKTTLQFLKFLEDRDLVSQDSAIFIAEVLHIIRRMDLLKVIPCIKNKQHFESEYLALTYCSFSNYRVLTVQLQEQLSQRDFETFRHECSVHLNVRSLDSATNVLQLLRKLEEEDVISQDDFDQLIKILECIENVKPLKFFQRLLDGDEAVAVPATKQPQRNHGQQVMYADRSNVQPNPSPAPWPENTGRVEPMPFGQPPKYESIHGVQTWQTGSFYDEPTPGKSHAKGPVRYEFDRQGSATTFSRSNARWFQGEGEVTPKQLVGGNARFNNAHQYQSMPPQHMHHPQFQRHTSENSVFSSMPINFERSPPHFAEQLSDTSPEPLPVRHIETYPRFERQHGYFEYERNRRSTPSVDAPQVYASPSILSHHQPVYPYGVMQPQAQHMHYQVMPHTIPPRIPEVVKELQNLSMNESDAVKDGSRYIPVDETEISVSNKEIGDLASPKQQSSPSSSPGNEKTIEELQKRNKELENFMYEHKVAGSYKMDSSPAGICLLINNVNFEKNRKYEEHDRRTKLNEQITNPSQKQSLPRLDLKDRAGSNIDADKLERLFKNFDFIVQRHDDLDQRGILRVMKEVSSADHAAYDCFLLIILSHGDNGCVFGVDGFPVNITKIQDYFFAQNCNTLVDKPKIFIIQACQGTKKMPAVAPDSDIMHDGPQAENNTVPNKADFLVAFSTVPGFVSYRSRLAGSYFVKEIVQIFKKHFERQDLLSMMIMVNDEVGKYENKQVPMPVATLRKKVFFHLKKDSELSDEEDPEQDEIPGPETSGLQLNLDRISEEGAVGGIGTASTIPRERVMQSMQESGEQDE